MKIDFTREQYRTLMRIFYYSDWVLNSQKMDRSECSPDFLEIRDILVSHAKEMDSEDMLYQDENGTEIAADDNKEFHDDIENYNESMFGDLLSQHMAGKIITDRFSEEELSGYTKEQLITLRNIVADLLDDEFCETGLDKLSFPEDFTEKLWADVKNEIQSMDE